MFGLDEFRICVYAAFSRWTESVQFGNIRKAGGLGEFDS